MFDVQKVIVDIQNIDLRNESHKIGWQQNCCKDNYFKLLEYSCLGFIVPAAARGEVNGQ